MMCPSLRLYLNVARISAMCIFRILSGLSSAKSETVADVSHTEICLFHRHRHAITINCMDINVLGE